MNFILLGFNFLTLLPPDILIYQKGKRVNLDMFLNCKMNLFVTPILPWNVTKPFQGFDYIGI